MFSGKDKKFISFMIAVVFAVTLFSGAEDSHAAGKSRIVLTNINSNFVLEKGSKYKIKYKKYGKAKKRKIRFKSSNRKVATVTRKGLIRAKKNGTVRITAYVKYKGKARFKKTVKVRVGPRVNEIRIKGYECVPKGKSVSLSRTVYPRNAKNKAVYWKSYNKSIAKVSSSGEVTGVEEGNTVIRAKAKDGSGVIAKFAMHVYKVRKGDANWVAHRGLHTSATENTRPAFLAAGKAGLSGDRSGFWGCECDIWETKHSEDDDFDLVINHDADFERVFGVEIEVKDSTAEDIRNHPVLGSEVCFFQDFLDICYDYKMVPVIELKDGALSDEAVAMAVAMVYETGLRKGGSVSAAEEFLKSADWISFHSSMLIKVRDCIENNDDYAAVKSPVLTYLVESGTTDEIIQEKIDLAKAEGFTTMSFYRYLLTEDVAAMCRESGLGIDAWTFKDSAAGRYTMHRLMEHVDFPVDHLTVDYRPW